MIIPYMKAICTRLIDFVRIIVYFIFYFLLMITYISTLTAILCFALRMLLLLHLAFYKPYIHRFISENCILFDYQI